MISGSASATACLTNSARVEGDRPVLAWPIRECRLRYPDGLDQAQARDPLVGMGPHPEARQTKRPGRCDSRSTQDQFLGILGEKRVNVLKFNLALDQLHRE